MRERGNKEKVQNELNWENKKTKKVENLIEIEE